MKKRILMLCLSSILFTGCTANQVKKEDKVLTIALASEGKGESLDATSYDSAMALYGAVYEPLVQYGEKGTFRSGLAETWEIYENGKEYLFHLKKGVRFSDGSEVNPEAVKFTIERAKYKNRMTSLQTLTNLKEVRVVGEESVQLSFFDTSNQVLAELSQARPLRIMSPHSVEEQAVTGEFKEAIGSGAFVIAESSSERTLLKPNKYFKADKKIDYELVFQTIEDGNGRTLALKSGAVDIVGGTFGEITDIDASLLEKEGTYHRYVFPGTMSHFVGFNPDSKKLSVPIRKAIARSIDKTALSEKHLKGLFQTDVKFVEEGNQYEIPYDLDKATRLLEAEGFEKNKDGFYENSEGELELNLVLQTTEFPEWKEKAELIENNLKKVGIKVQMTILDAESYYDVLWSRKKYDLIFYRTYTDALLPYNFLSSLYQNIGKEKAILANDEELSRQLAMFGKIMDENQQQELFNSIFKRLSEEALAIPIEYKDEKFLTSKKVSELRYSGLADAPIDFKHLMVE